MFCLFNTQFTAFRKLRGRLPIQLAILSVQLYSTTLLSIPLFCHIDLLCFVNSLSTLYATYLILLLSPIYFTGNYTSSIHIHHFKDLPLILSIFKETSYIVMFRQLRVFQMAKACWISRDHFNQRSTR